MDIGRRIDFLIKIISSGGKYDVFLAFIKIIVIIHAVKSWNKNVSRVK